MIAFLPPTSPLISSCTRVLPQMKKKELQLYLQILVCILYVTEEIPMAVLNASLLIQGNELDSNAAVFSFAISAFQLGRKSSVFSQVSKSLHSDPFQAINPVLIQVLDKYGSLGKAKVALGAHSAVLKMLVLAVSCCNAVVDTFSPDLTDTVQGIAGWLYDEANERKQKDSTPPVQAGALESELEIRTA
jgi:hypothetical protein